MRFLYRGWLRKWAGLLPSMASDVRAQVRAAFLDDDPAWLETCWPRYQFVATAALERLS